MKLLQAAMRDKSAKAWREGKVMYRVGSVFKGCHHCGDVEEDGSGRPCYTSGLNVYRSYHPTAVGWTYWCWDCGAKDAACWADATDIGQVPLLGNREAVRKRKLALRKERMDVEPRVKAPTRNEELARLEAELDRLEKMLQGRKK